MLTSKEVVLPRVTGALDGGYFAAVVSGKQFLIINKTKKQTSNVNLTGQR